MATITHAQLNTHTLSYGHGHPFSQSNEDMLSAFPIPPSHIPASPAIGSDSPRGCVPLCDVSGPGPTSYFDRVDHCRQVQVPETYGNSHVGSSAHANLGANIVRRDSIDSIQGSVRSMRSAQSMRGTHGNAKPPPIGSPPRVPLPPVPVFAGSAMSNVRLDSISGSLTPTKVAPRPGGMHALYPHGEQFYRHHEKKASSDSAMSAVSGVSTITSASVSSARSQYSYMSDESSVPTLAEFGVAIPVRLSVMPASIVGPDTGVTFAKSMELQSRFRGHRRTGSSSSSGSGSRQASTSTEALERLVRGVGRYSSEDHHAHREYGIESMEGEGSKTPTAETSRFPPESAPVPRLLKKERAPRNRPAFARDLRIDIPSASLLCGSAPVGNGYGYDYGYAADHGFASGQAMDERESESAVDEGQSPAVSRFPPRARGTAARAAFVSPTSSPTRLASPSSAGVSATGAGIGIGSSCSSTWNVTSGEEGLPTAVGASFASMTAAGMEMGKGMISPMLRMSELEGRDGQWDGDRAGPAMRTSNCLKSPTGSVFSISSVASGRSAAQSLRERVTGMLDDVEAFTTAAASASESAPLPMPGITTSAASDSATAAINDYDAVSSAGVAMTLNPRSRIEQKPSQSSLNMLNNALKAATAAGPSVSLVSEPDLSADPLLARAVTPVSVLSMSTMSNASTSGYRSPSPAELSRSGLRALRLSGHFNLSAVAGDGWATGSDNGNGASYIPSLSPIPPLSDLESDVDGHGDRSVHDAETSGYYNRLGLRRMESVDLESAYGGIEKEEDFDRHQYRCRDNADGDNDNTSGQRQSSEGLFNQFSAKSTATTPTAQRPALVGAESSATALCARGDGEEQGRLLAPLATTLLQDREADDAGALLRTPAPVTLARTLSQRLRKPLPPTPSEESESSPKEEDNGNQCKTEENPIQMPSASLNRGVISNSSSQSGQVSWPRLDRERSGSLPSSSYATSIRTSAGSHGKRSRAGERQDIYRGATSPDIDAMMSATPRPVRSVRSLRSLSLRSNNSHSRSRRSVSASIGTNMFRSVSERSSVVANAPLLASLSNNRISRTSSSYSSSSTSNSGRSTRCVGFTSTSMALHPSQASASGVDEQGVLVKDAEMDEEYGVAIARHGGAYDLTPALLNDQSEEAALERLEMTDELGGLQCLRGRVDDGMPADWEDEDIDEDISETDSDIDLHTPLPHILLREGVLSANSKVLSDATMRRDSMMSNATRASTTSVMTKSGLFKDERDTEKRRRRHRDGKLLREGLGLTTGLGWSDSEDEDAPSPLTHRLSRLVLSRKNSVTSSHFAPPSSASAWLMHSSPADMDEGSVGARLKQTRSLHLSKSYYGSVVISGTASGGERHPLSKSISAANLQSVVPRRSSPNGSLEDDSKRHSTSPGPTSRTTSSSSGSLPMPLTPGENEIDSLLYFSAKSVSSKASIKGCQGLNTSVPTQNTLRSKAPASGLPSLMPKKSIPSLKPPSSSSGKLSSPTSAAAERAPPLPQCASSMRAQTRLPALGSAGSSSTATPRPLKLPALQQQQLQKDGRQNKDNKRILQPGQPAPRPGALLGHNRDFHDGQHALRTSSRGSASTVDNSNSNLAARRPIALSMPTSTSSLRPPTAGTGIRAPSPSPSSATSSPGSICSGSRISAPTVLAGRPRTGTGMAYRLSSLPTFRK